MVLTAVRDELPDLSGLAHWKLGVAFHLSQHIMG